LSNILFPNQKKLNKMPKRTAQVRFTDTKLKNSLEIIVPAGLTHKELAKINLGDLLAKFRPSGCLACLSGQHFNIREQFEKILQVEIGGI
jgi:hypothetical protein